MFGSWNPSLSQANIVRMYHVPNASILTPLISPTLCLEVPQPFGWLKVCQIGPGFFFETANRTESCVLKTGTHNREVRLRIMVHLDPVIKTGLGSYGLINC